MEDDEQGVSIELTRGSMSNTAVPKREPLLSDEEMIHLCEIIGPPEIVGGEVRKWYEAKIASGELIHVGVAKLCRVRFLTEWGEVKNLIKCECGASWYEADHLCGAFENRCVSCRRTLVGAEIAEACPSN